MDSFRGRQLSADPLCGKGNGHDSGGFEGLGVKLKSVAVLGSLLAMSLELSSRAESPRRLADGDIVAVWLRFPLEASPERCGSQGPSRPPEGFLLAVLRIRDGIARSPLAPPLPVPSGSLSELEAGVVRHLLPSGPSFFCLSLEVVDSRPRLREIIGLLLDPPVAFPANRPASPHPSVPSRRPLELPSAPLPGDYWRLEDRERLQLPGSG